MLTEHPPEIGTPTWERTSWASRILVPEMWGTVAIAMMWLAVLFVGVFGPTIVVNNSSGYTNMPTVVVVAFFALLGTAPVAGGRFAHGAIRSFSEKGLSLAGWRSSGALI